MKFEKYMMPSSSIWIPSLPPFEAVKLGRFITNIERPQECYHEPSISDDQASTVCGFSFSGQNQNERRASLGAYFTRLVSIKHSSIFNSTIQVDQATGNEYSLNNSTLWFDRAISSPETKSWIEKNALRGNKIYMVVGFQTLTNPRITITSTRGQQAASNLGIADILSLIISGAVIPDSISGPSTTQSQHQTVSSAQVCLDAPGERVCSLLYRRIKHRWLSSRKDDYLKLSPTHVWSCIEGNRREAYSESEDEEEESEDEEDMIYLELDDNDNTEEEQRFIIIQ